MYNYMFITELIEHSSIYKCTRSSEGVTSLTGDDVERAVLGVPAAHQRNLRVLPGLAQAQWLVRQEVSGAVNHRHVTQAEISRLLRRHDTKM